MDLNPDKPSLTLLLGGDVMLGRGVNETLHRSGPAYPFERLTHLTRCCDLFFVNLECAISPHPLLFSGARKAFYFRGDPPAAQTLTHAGIVLVSLANNHALDADEQGLVDTLEILDRKGIAHVGAGRDADEAAAPAILHKSGFSLGVLAYCDHQADFAASSRRAGIRYLDLQQPQACDILSRDVAELAARVDHVIVAFHWQTNWAPRVEPVYRSAARRAVEAGARVIWGHSPHHFQGVEWFDKAVAVYSTGDLIDDYALDDHFRNDRQLLFRLVLGRRAVEAVSGYPVELDYARAQPASPEARRWIIPRLQEFCHDLGSHILEQDHWLEIHPGT